MSKLPKDVAIRVADVHKDFHLPHHNEDSIKRRVTQVFKKKDKTVDVHNALKGITFDIKKGEFFGIVGRNGSGKSTLLKIISEIYQPTAGYAQTQGKVVAFIELGVGFNPQLSGRENVFLNGAMLGFSRQEMREMYDEIVAFAELEDFMELPLKNYSSGMKVRLAFSVAIRAQADILILDEVLAVGDADFQRKCYNYFKQLKEDNKTIVLVSHSMGLIKEYCDRAILIEGGVIVESGTADEVADAYNRLFNKSIDSKKEQTNDRWGSNEIQFGSVKVKVTFKKVTVKCEVKNGEQPLKDIIIALDIYDSNNKLVGGVEDRLQRENPLQLKPNKTKQVIYTFDNIFGGGEYSAVLAIKSKDGNYIYDYWKKAVAFTNINDVDNYFPVILPVEITISK